MRRQPVEARVWGSLFRSWFPGEGRHRGKAKRRSARRERVRGRHEITAQERERHGTGHES